jgi:glycosyltransferase involved in cell wall biosynthesis
MKIGKLSIIVPVYNEVKTVGTVIKILSDLEVKGTKIEVIIVDDGSSDGSTKILKKIKSRKFKVVLNKKNAGKGAAVKTALGIATGEYVIIQDADLEYNPEEIRKLVRKAEKGNYLAVYGSRNREIKNRYLYAHYYWGSKMLYEMINFLFGQKLTDPETCYKLLHRDLFRFIEITEKGFGIEIEITEGKKIRAKDGIRAIYLIGKYWASDMHYGIVDRWLRKIRLDSAVKYLKFSSKDVVVDLGCGRQARLGWMLLGKVKRYVGIDMGVPKILIGNLVLVPADLEKSWPKNLRADKIVGAAILEHLENPKYFFSQCYKVLNKGGELALTTPAPPMADFILKMLVSMKLIRADEVFDHKHYFGLEDLNNFAKESGFKVVKMESFLWGLNNLIAAKK